MPLPCFPSHHLPLRRGYDGGLALGDDGDAGAHRARWHPRAGPLGRWRRFYVHADVREALGGLEVPEAEELVSRL